MNPSAVIESLDIVKDTLPGLRSAVIAAVEDNLPFQYAEEALNRSIVPAVAGAAHAADHAVLGQQHLIVFAGVLRPTVRVMQHATGRVTPLDRQRQGCHRFNFELAGKTFSP